MLWSFQATTHAVEDINKNVRLKSTVITGNSSNKTYTAIPCKYKYQLLLSSNSNLKK